MKEIRNFLEKMESVKKIELKLWLDELNKAEDKEKASDLFLKQLKKISLPAIETGKGKKKKKFEIFSHEDFFDFLMQNGIDLNEDDKAVLASWKERQKVLKRTEIEQDSITYSSWQEKMKEERFLAEQEMSGDKFDPYMECIYIFCEEVVRNLCNKSQRFAQQYLNGSPLKDAVKSFTAELNEKKARSISDSEVYCRLAKFYWPEMKVAMRLIFQEPDEKTHHLAKVPEDGREKLEKPVVFHSLEELGKIEAKREAKFKSSSKTKTPEVETKKDEKKPEDVQITMFSL